MRRLLANRGDGRLARCGEVIQRIAEIEVRRANREAAGEASGGKKKGRKAKKVVGMEGDGRKASCGGQSSLQAQTKANLLSNLQSNLQSNSQSNPQSNSQSNAPSNPQSNSQSNSQNQPSSLSSQPAKTQEEGASKHRKSKSKAKDGFKVVRNGSSAANFMKNAKIATSYSMFYDPYESEDEEVGGQTGSEAQSLRDQTSLDGEIASSMMMETDEWAG